MTSSRDHRTAAAPRILAAAALALLAPAATGQGWPSARGGGANRGAFDRDDARPIGEPRVAWTLREPGRPGVLGWWGHAAIVEDVDGDGRLEAVVVAGDLAVRPPAAESLLVLDLATGQVERRIALREGERVQWSGPTAADLDGESSPEVVIGVPGRVLALDLRTGRTLWEVEALEGVMGLAAWPGALLFQGYGRGAHLRRLDGRTGKTLWSFETGGSTYAVPAIGDLDGDAAAEILVHAHRYDPSREVLFCLDPGGKERWRFEGRPSADQERNAPAELGWVPDFGYHSPILGDFAGSRAPEVLHATRCRTYLLDARGRTIWDVPLVEGFGVLLEVDAGGKVVPDEHGTGGDKDAWAAGDLDGDGRLDPVLSMGPEVRVRVDRSSGRKTYERVARGNRVRALDGRTGRERWRFEGEYPDPAGVDRMLRPLLVDLDGDRRLDVIVGSTDGHLYGLSGRDGRRSWALPFPDRDPLPLALATEEGRLLVLVGTMDAAGTIELAAVALDPPR